VKTPKTSTSTAQAGKVPEINLIIRAIEEHRTKLQNLTLGFSWSGDLRKIVVPLTELYQTLQLLDGILDAKPEFVRRRYDRAETSIKEALDFVVERINERANSRDTSAFQYGPFGCLVDMDNALVFLLNALSKANNEYKAEQPAGGHAKTEQNDRPILSDTEQNILEALGTQTMTGEVLAKRAGYPYNSNFKNTLSSLRKRGILGNKSPGYFVESKYHSFLKKSDQGQD
jgi:hypothetical protein